MKEKRESLLLHTSKKKLMTSLREKKVSMTFGEISFVKKKGFGTGWREIFKKILKDSKSLL